MPVENPAANDQPEQNPKKIFAAKDEILVTWQLLPEEHQATMLLVLLDDVMKGEQRAWLREALALRWPLETGELATAFPAVQLTREDLEQACFSEDEIAQFSDEDLRLVGQTMRDHYVHDVFWPEFEYVVTDFLEKKGQRPFQERLAESSAAAQPFYAWMAAIDQQTWALVGCSIYDLPDADFQSMFGEEMTPAEVVNRVLEVAGFDFEEE